MELTFIQRTTNLLNSIPSCEGNHAQLAHALSEALNRLEGVIDQANAQLKAGDGHAAFNKSFIAGLNR